MAAQNTPILKEEKQEDIEQREGIVLPSILFEPLNPSKYLNKKLMLRFLKTYTYHTDHCSNHRMYSNPGGGKIVGLTSVSAIPAKENSILVESKCENEFPQ